MGDQELDQYEQQLLSVFVSCDLEKKGTLDARGLEQLCDKLQLEEKGTKLIEQLLGGGSADNRVTFHAFRDALLALLDQGPVMEQPSTSTAKEVTTPKLMFGKKKYGRRSSPLDSPQEVNKESSDRHQEDTVLLQNSPVVVHPKKRKTAVGAHNQNATELADDTFVPLGYIHDTEVLVRGNVVVGKDLQNAWGISNISVNNDEHPGSSIQTHCIVRNSPSWYSYDTIKSLPVYNSIMNSEVIVDLWEGAGLQKAGVLLQDLGFTKPKVNVTELMSILKEEILNLQSTCVEGDWSMTETLLQAMLCICQEELHTTKASLELVLGERDKLQLNICEANERASLLAQEVDENHAQLEKSANVQIKLIEQKHSEQVKVLMEQLGFDREQLMAKYNTLEVRAKKLEEINSQQRNELSALKKDNTHITLEKDCAIKGWTKFEALYCAAQNELMGLDTFREELTKLRSVCEVEQVLPLKERIAEIQAANTELRDRNDELTMQLEALTLELRANKMKEFSSIPEVCGNNTSDAVITDELKEQIAELQKSLELMREEFEKCEDYWSSKVEEERILHDQEQNTLGSKYTELLAKIKEYEQDMDKCSENSDGRLSTIPERPNLEQQIVATEEECLELQRKLDQKTEHLAVDRKRWQVEHDRLTRTVRKLRKKARPVRVVARLKTVYRELQKAEHMKAESLAVLILAQEELILCEEAQRNQEARAAEEREHVLNRLIKEFNSPQELVKGLRCCDKSCDDNKRSLFKAVRQQGKYMGSLQRNLYRVQDRTKEMGLLFEQAKDLHKKEVIELERLLNIAEAKVKNNATAHKLKEQFMIKNDLILTDVYEENARLTKSLAALELRYKELIQHSKKPSSSMGKVC